MQLRILLTDLCAAPGFLDPSGDAAPVLDAAPVATLYSFLPADTSFTLLHQQPLCSARCCFG